MVLHLFAVFDRDTGTYNIPFLQNHIALAIRGFKTLVNDKNTTVHHHPKSFELRHLGTFNDQTGQLIADTPETVATAEAVLDPVHRLQLPLAINEN